MTTAKQSVQLKQTQTLTITPEMRQSLKVLQCNRQELEQEIARMLDENIMLRRLDGDEDFQYSDTLGDNSHAADDFADEFGDNEDYSESMSDEIPDMIDCDVAWEELYDSPEDYEYSNNNEQDEGFQEGWVEDALSFDEQLESSLRLCDLDDEEKRLATTVLSYLDENYFLSLPVDKLAKKLNVRPAVLKQLIEVIKHLDPPGVACQNIQECLLAQLHCLPYFSEAIGDAHDILRDYFTHIGQKDGLIKRRLGLSDEAFDEAMQLIRTLSPYPRAEDNAQGQRILPDVYVHQRMGMYYASLNRDMRYDIGLNEEYAAMTADCQGDEKYFMKAQLQMAKFFLRALDQRHQTVLRVSNAIVMHQQEYFEQGDKVLKPLLMKDLAEILGLAESTISRAVSGKYLSFNHRLIELRHFFSNEASQSELHNFGQETGGSATAVKALIKEMIDNENPRKPLSDSKIEKALKSKGVDISRRTVAKYRESLGISATSKRKRRN
ncbi:MAG: RNA polymerase sigma-54 factor [Gammaproteobacteria bacterium]|nr:MAG: RNA polymerase sigma-54 factor [Gammaproteobacteria bacterium]